jgi:hypothetical protein
MAASGPVADGSAALAKGRWEQARAAFEAALARGEAETGQACFGLAMAYRMTDLDEAEELTGWVVQMARAARDVDLELVALSQLGLIRVGKGLTDAGFALIDEAMAAS